MNSIHSSKIEKFKLGSEENSIADARVTSLSHALEDRLVEAKCALTLFNELSSRIEQLEREIDELITRVESTIVDNMVSYT